SALALMVLFVGLRNTRSALLIVISIPVSIVATMAFMAMGKVSFNFMSIGGLAVGAGMMVDASIVVLESIHRHSLQKKDLLAAVESGVAEVSASVISGTFTTVVVLIPILFMTGLAQRLFRDFAFTLGVSLMISLLTALILLPALVILTRSRGRYGEKKGSSSVQWAYARSLGWALDHRTVVVGTCLAVFVLSAWGVTRTGFQVLPELDEDQFTMRLILPPDANIQAVETAVDAAEALLKNRPEVQAYVTDAGVDPKAELTTVQTVAKPNEARILVTLRPGSYERGDREKVIAGLRSNADRVTGARLEFLSGQSFLSRALGTGESTQLLRLVGDDLTTLAKLADELVARLTGDAHLKDVTSRGNVWTNQIQVIVDRYQAAARGLSVRDIAQALQTAVEGRIAGKFIREEKETDIRVRLRPEDRTSRDDLKLLPMRLGQRHDAADQPLVARGNPGRNEDDRVALLEQVATLDPGRGPREILRTDRRRNVTINANIVGAAFSNGEEKATEAAGALQLPPGYEVQAGRERLELMSSIGSLSLALLVAAMLTYAVMAVQFESVRWPFVIMLVAPTTIAGPALIFNLLGIPINVLVLIGAVVLIGLVVNNGILMVDYTLTVERSGLPRRDAVIEACRVRLHPILMSTGTTVFGVLPLCFSWGKGAALRTSLALTVNAGLIASLFFTLFLVPVLYSLAAGRSGKPVDPADIGK
ncbi:MAG: efflux RND transporter permease subunit, partial [Desulfomonile sp.]|nr:efflux RND transporter permease subunit [Desulfomonile sp.]